MSPIDQSVASKRVLDAIRETRMHRGSDCHNAFLRLFGDILCLYQARLVDCPEHEIPALRAAAIQVTRLRDSAGTGDDVRINPTL